MCINIYIYIYILIGGQTLFPDPTLFPGLTLFPGPTLFTGPTGDKSVHLAAHSFFVVVVVVGKNHTLYTTVNVFGKQC